MATLSKIDPAAVNRQSSSWRSAAHATEPVSDAHATEPVSDAPAPPLGRLARVLYVTLAGGFIALAVIGIFLPGLPTTPFLLLASYFLLRAWPSMNERLLRSQFFGEVLRDWQQRRGVQRHIKLKAIASVLVMVSATLLLTALPPISRGLLASGALLGIWVIYRLREIASRRQ